MIYDLPVYIHLQDRKKLTKKLAWLYESLCTQKILSPFIFFCLKLAFGKHPELRNLGILGVQAVSSPNARRPADFGTLGDSGESNPTRFFNKRTSAQATAFDGELVGLLWSQKLQFMSPQEIRQFVSLQCSPDPPGNPKSQPGSLGPFGRQMR